MNQAKLIFILIIPMLLVGCIVPESRSRGSAVSAKAVEIKPRSAIAKAEDGAEAHDAKSPDLHETEQLDQMDEVDDLDESNEPPARSHEEIMDKGNELYLKHYCGLCHTLASAGTTGTFGPSHDGLAELLEARLQDSTYAGTATTPAEYLMESLTDPAVYIAPGYAGSAHPMPEYSFLPPEELETLVQFLLWQRE